MYIGNIRTSGPVNMANKNWTTYPSFLRHIIKRKIHLIENPERKNRVGEVCRGRRANNLGKRRLPKSTVVRSALCELAYTLESGDWENVDAGRCPETNWLTDPESSDSKGLKNGGSTKSAGRNIIKEKRSCAGTHDMKCHTVR